MKRAFGNSALQPRAQLLSGKEGRKAPAPTRKQLILGSLIPILINVLFLLDNESHLRRETTTAPRRPPPPPPPETSRGASARRKQGPRLEGLEGNRCRCWPDLNLSCPWWQLSLPGTGPTTTPLVSYLLPGLSVPAGGGACVISAFAYFSYTFLIPFFTFHSHSPSSHSHTQSFSFSFYKIFSPSPFLVLFFTFFLFSFSLPVFKSKESTQYTHTASDYIEVNASNIILSLTCQHMHI